MTNRYALKLADSLLADPTHHAAFLEALDAGVATQNALLWLQPPPSDGSLFETLTPAPWQPEFVDRIAPHQRPGQNPLHEQGAYYCLDLSSVFEASVLCELTKLGERPRRILDVCAAPGGKSLFAWRALAPETLLCNEVNGKRLGILKSNLNRCGAGAATVLSRDPSRLGEALETTAELVLVDAPCSGQSLIARGEDVPGAFHPVTIKQCAGRQKRILAESAALVAPGGHLFYSTCTFSRDENEAVVGWLLKKFPEFQAVEVPTHDAHRSPHASFPCYRLWPHEGYGAGGFVALLRRTAL